MTMNIAEKKIVIEKALSPWFSGESLEEAVIIWELRYSRQPTLAFQRFLSDICTTPALNAQRSKILQALIRSLTGENGMPLKSLPEALAALPAATAVQAPAAKPVPEPAAPLPVQATEALRGCVQLVNTVFSRTPGDMNVRMRELLLERLPALDLTLPARTALQAWFSGGGAGPQDVFIAEPALRALVQTVHAGLCEFLSRSRADQVLKEALQQTAGYYRGSFPLERLWAA